MFDKAEQQRRAQQFTQAQASMGLTKPVLPMPVISKPVPVYVAPMPKVRKSLQPVIDLRGMPIQIGDEVVYSNYKGAAVYVGKVVAFSQSRKSVRIFGRKSLRSGPPTEFYKPHLSVVKVA